jgi:phospholipase C
MSQFYVDAAAGNLTSLSFINPSCCGVGTTSMHPTGLISAGEALIKNVYEALRASPQWEETLFILTFDETGGFHDHVPPPLAPRPDNLTYTASTPAGEKYMFPFNRLGGRIPTLLISPWVSKGYVEQKAANADGEVVSYSATSILRTLGYLFDFEPYNPRVEWSPSFAHLVNSKARKNTPTSLPDANPFKA